MLKLGFIIKLLRIKDHQGILKQVDFSHLQKKFPVGEIGLLVTSKASSKMTLSMHPQRHKRIKVRVRGNSGFSSSSEPERSLR